MFRSSVSGITYSNLVPKITKFEPFFSYSTPKLLQNIPNSVVYPYQYVDYYASNSTSAVVSTDADQSLSFNAINLSGTP